MTADSGKALGVWDIAKQGLNQLIFAKAKMIATCCFT